MDRTEAVDHAWIRERYTTTPPLVLIEQLKGTDDAAGLYLRSMAFAAICDAKAARRDREAAAALAPDDAVIQRAVQVSQARGRDELLELANRFWDGATDDPDGWRARRMAAGIALHATPHRNAGHRRAAERLEMAARASLSEDPSGPSPLADLALAQAELGKTQDARTTLDRIHDETGFPPWPTVWRLDAIVARKRRDWGRSTVSWLEAQTLLGRPDGLVARLFWRWNPVLLIVLPALFVLSAIGSGRREPVLAGFVVSLASMGLATWIVRPAPRRFFSSIVWVGAAFVALWFLLPPPVGVEDPLERPVLNAAHLEDDVLRLVEGLTVGDPSVVVALSGDFFEGTLDDWERAFDGFEVVGVAPIDCPFVGVPSGVGARDQRCFVVALRKGTSLERWEAEVDLEESPRGWVLSGLSSPDPPP